VDRKDVFLATKVWTSNLAHGDVLRTAEESLDRLGVEYVDVLYVHWPANEYDPEDTLTAFDQLYD
jgi:2,5-diketo-D-gluconate reductase B